MSTETTTADLTESNSAKKQAITGFLEGLGVMGLFGSLVIHYALASFVLVETIGDELATLPDWMLIAINSTLSIPVVASMTMASAWLLSLFTGEDVDWASAAICGAGAAVLLSPVIAVLEGGIV